MKERRYRRLSEKDGGAHETHNMVDLIAGLSLESLPEDQRGVVVKALQLNDRNIGRFYRGRDEMKAMRLDVLQQAFDRVHQLRGWEVTTESFQIALMFAALNHNTLHDPQFLAWHHAAGLLVVQVEAAIELVKLDDAKSPAPRFTKLVDYPDGEVAQESYQHAMLERTAYHDGLTGLLNNREAIRDLFMSERDRFKREAGVDEVMLVVELDIIHFKRLNDAYGNAVVDAEVLAPLGRAFKNRFRGNDILCRIGGDEFTLIFSRVKKSATADLLQEVLKTLENCRYGEQVYGKTKMTARVGATTLNQVDMDAIPTRDANTFFKVLRDRPLVAAADVKRQMKAGVNNQISLWTPEMQADKDVTWAKTAEDLERDFSTSIAQLARSHGQAVADEFASNLRAGLLAAGELATRPTK